MCLYAADQEGLYIAYSDKFKKLAAWMLSEDELLELKHYVHRFPDICGKCGIVFGHTLGGRIRDACPCCKGSFPHAEKLLRLWWPSMVESIFKSNHEFIEGYLAKALILYGEAREHRRRHAIKQSRISD